MCLRSDSFDDRICNDLSEVILQYLPLKDKIRLECVSKQFQRTAFRRVYEFKLEELKRPTLQKLWPKVIELKSESELKAIESLLKKCPNIQSIDLNHFPANNRQISKLMLQMITKYCNHLIEFKGKLLNSNECESQEFCRKFGPKLKYFRYAKHVFEYNLFPNIESIEEYLFMGPNPTEKLLQLKSGNHLKKLLISINLNKEHFLAQVMQKFQKLTHLTLWLRTKELNKAFKDFPSH